MINTKEAYKFIHHVSLRGLDTAGHLLQKGMDFTHDQNNESELLEAKLAPDMFNFTRQIQIFTDNVAGAIARGAGLAKPSMPDTEKTFRELIDRVNKTKEFVKTIDPEKVEGTDNVQIKLPWMPEGMYFDGQTYFGNFVLQNMMFHLTTAYDILRHKGVQIGKGDFTGQLEMKK